MREIRQSGLEGGGTELNRSSLPLSFSRRRARQHEVALDSRGLKSTLLKAKL